MYNSISRRRLWLWISICMLAYLTVVAAQSVTFRWVNHCGDWVLRVDLWEVCDDGNYIDGDGCSRNCEDENAPAKEIIAPSYDSDFVNETTGYKVFMDSKWVNHIIPDGKEVCDYGDRNGVVCDPGYGGKCYFCTEWCFLEEVTWASCGDGIVNHLQEQCDDGNLTNNDGCSSMCKKENTMIAPISNSNTITSTLPTTTTTTTTTIQIREWRYEPLPLPTVNNQVIDVTPTKTPVKNTVNVIAPSKVITPTKVTNKVITPTKVTTKVTPKVTVKNPVKVTMTPTKVTSVSQNLTPVQKVALNNDWPIVANQQRTVQPSTTTKALPTMQPASIRQNIAMRTSPTKTGIGITTPYPDSLSDTWASLLVSSKVVFMRVLSLLMVMYMWFWFRIRD